MSAAANGRPGTGSIHDVDAVRFVERSKDPCSELRPTNGGAGRATRHSLMPVPLRILFLVSTLRQSGPTMQLHNIVRHLDRRQFEPVIVTLSAEPHDTMRASFRELGTRVESLSVSRIRSLVGGSWRGRIERATGFGLGDRCILHSQGFRADAISARSLHGVPRLATVHNYPFDDYPLKFGPVQGRWMARRHLRAFRSLPQLVSCSGFLAHALERHGLHAAIIRNGVDTSKFRVAPPASRAAERERLGLPEHARVGVCVGSLIPRKNPLSIVRAVLQSELRDLAMIFVGGGELAEDAKQAAREDTRVRFVGHCDDVLPFLQVADFFVSASRSEGLPTAVLEALACGLPVVLSDIEPHREILELLPRAGSLCDPDDASSLIAAIETAARRPAVAGAELAARAATLFGSERVSHGYQDLYRQVIATQDREAGI